ncbi:MAG: hypothetical protein LUO85_02790, partial [Methanomassiliicoccales archaeon]|nr:hypothetical protein [Methanomassiliicoccales archaeon]
IGLVIGVVVYAVQSSFDMSFLLFALLFAVLEEMIKLVLLNLRRFRGKLDTPFYGLTIGLGIGGAMGFGAVFQSLPVLSFGDAPIAVLNAIILVVLAVQFCLLHGANGALIGAGVARSMPFSYFSQAVLYHIGFNLLMIGFYLPLPVPFNYLALLAATIVVVYSYWHIHYRLIPDMISKAVEQYDKKADRLKKP